MTRRLALLGAAHELPVLGLLVLAPEIDRSFGSGANLGSAVGLHTLVVAALALPLATYVTRRSDRAGVSVAAATVRGGSTVLAGMAALPGAALLRLAEGATATVALTVHPPLLYDVSGPGDRVGAFALYHGARRAAGAVAAVIVILLVAGGVAWRGVVVVLGLAALLATAAGSRLRDPGVEAVRTDRDRTVFETVNEVLRVPTVRRALAAYAVLGMLYLPLWTYLLTHLEERWRASLVESVALFGAAAAGGVVGLAVLAPRGRRLFDRSPAALARAGAAVLAVGSFVLLLSMTMPVFVLYAALVVAAFALLAPVDAVLHLVLLSAVAPEDRCYATAMSSVFLLVVGGFGGALLLGSVEGRFGPAVAIGVLALAGGVAALILRRAADLVEEDMARLEDHPREADALEAMARTGRHPPLLSCRAVDFSYGQVQVLFGVDLEIDEGEMVALLGTNGAGKSTLLAVISGLAFPSRGSVRFTGRDITSVDAERRVSLGIGQIPGGRAVFGPLTVAENLRVFAHSYGDRRAANAAVDRALEAFPRLAERRNQVAATLSGGEQQMLALSKAFIVQPRLLLIDELALGLAPMIVADLLDMVRRINADGTAVILVEQSVSTALSLAPRAYFMEKGEIRFSGDGPDLLERSDLLRSVFLEGAAAALGSAAR